MTHSHDLATRIDRMVRRLHSGIHARAPEFDPEKVGPLGGMALLAIDDAKQLSIQALTREMARDKAQITRLVQMLERKGFLLRLADEADARVSLLRLTEKGETLVNDIKSVISDTLEGVLEPLSETERATLTTLLGKL